MYGDMKMRACRSLVLLLGAALFVVGAAPLFAGEKGPVIADYTVAKDSVLRSIPKKYITAAKKKLHILYCGTSHSSQVATGLRGLMEFKPGDDKKFKVSFNGKAGADALDIDYHAFDKNMGLDLSHDRKDDAGHPKYFHATCKYLDSHPKCNVVMWSWCSIERHDVRTYLDNFKELIDMYKSGGSKGRTKSNAVDFVFMTGYARGKDHDKPEPPYIKSPYQNRERIVAFCKENGCFCLDYWSQDCYDYGTDKYKPKESGNSNAMHLAYQNAHTEGKDWFQCRNYKSGSPTLPAHANNHITGNRRAYAAWWIWARLAGWTPKGKK